MARRMFVPFVLLALLGTLLTPLTASAQQDDDRPPPPGRLIAPGQVVQRSTTGSYIVVMEADPLIVTEGQDNLNTPTARSRGRALARGHDKTLEDADVGAENKVQSFTNALNGFSAVMSFEEAKDVAGQPGVQLVIPDELRQLTTDSSTTFLGLDGPGGAWATGVTGEGVIVGVIDSGIWPEHPSFADDGSYSSPGVTLDESVYPACDFGNQAHNPNDAPFTCNNKLIGARQTLLTYRALIGAAPGEYDSARDDNGHGTHTASTAAGNAGVEASMYGNPIATISGVAPRAHIIAYKGLGDLGGFTSDLAASIDQAVADGVDVINYSVGGGAGLTGGDEIAFLFAADAGVFVATSAGNSGPGAGTVGGPGTVPWITTVGASTQPRFLQGTITLGDGTEIIGASVTNPAGGTLIDAEDAGGDLCIPGTLDPGLVSGNIVLCRRGAIGRADKSLAVSQAGGAGMILYNNVDSDNLFTDTHWVPSIHIDNTPGLQVKAYIDANAGSATAQLTTGQVGTWDAAPSMTIFSSRGPDIVAEDIIKPDVTAPGLQILAGHTPTPIGGVSGELFQAIAGTSMSSPHVAGLFALIKQEHPDWTAAMAKSALMTTAYQDVRDNDRVSQASPFAMGAGHVDPGAAVQKGSSFQPGLVYDAGFLDYLGFLCDAEPSALNPATCPSLEASGIPIDASDLNLASIGIAELAGSQTVTRTVTSVAQERGNRTYSVSVTPPPGYDVVVSPSSFTIRSGESATYTVTITNNGGGVVGGWSHGSLEWNDNTGNYRVYSPISVKGALFDSDPASVETSGESGSTDIAVKFGYSGSYEAGAHGLIPSTVFSDNVAQDPDQNFSPADLGNGANLHQITVSGGAFLKIAMPPEVTAPGVDLDVFVFDPAGTLVAQSTSGGTDEIIEIASPIDGTWDVYVHGWQTAGPNVDYDMYSWVISATPGGGNLTVSGAPAAATVGETATITASWSGAALGEWHLGAVSHTGPTGLMGLTLIDVDNR